MNHPRAGRTRPDYGVDGYPYLVGVSAAALLLAVASGVLGAYGHPAFGRAFGIDIWSTTDLSGNTKARLLRNASIEGVAERVEARDDDARSLSFDAASFDVVLSMLCLHNIEDDRDKALREMVRVLRPGGTVIVSDLAGTSEYAKTLEELGLTVDHGGTEWGTFPFQRVVVAKKPAVP